MKRYILITRNIKNIGGGQLYCQNKIEYLHSINWETYLFSSRRKGNIMLKPLFDSQKHIIKELDYVPTIFTKKKIRNIIDKLLNYIGEIKTNEEVIIESHNPITSLWGELLARELKCKHFVYLIDEEFKGVPKSIIEFLSFKHERREVAGISKESLNFLFQNYKRLETNESYYLSAASSSGNIADITNSKLDSVIKRQVNIGCISRLEKPFIPTMIDSIIEFANMYPQKEIQLILVGDSTNKKSLKLLKRKISRVKNIYPIYTGRLFPLPKVLFSKVDFFIGAAGAAKQSAFENVPTLSIDPNSHEPIGLLGYDTSNSLFSNEKYSKTITEVLTDMFVNKKLSEVQKKMKGKITPKSIEKSYGEHFDFIYSSTKKKEYYEVISTHLPFYRRLRSTIKYYIT